MTKCARKLITTNKSRLSCISFVSYLICFKTFVADCNLIRGILGNWSLMQMWWDKRQILIRKVYIFTIYLYIFFWVQIGEVGLMVSPHKSTFDILRWGYSTRAFHLSLDWAITMLIIFTIFYVLTYEHLLNIFKHFKTWEFLLPICIQAVYSNWHFLIKFKKFNL